MTRLAPDGEKKPSLLKRIFSDNRYSWVACLCTVGIMFLVFYCYNLFPFGGKTILRMDLYHQYGPLFAELYDRVTHLESLIYSWRTGLGSPFLGNYFNYLSSPSAIIILLLGHENMPEAIAGMILVKAAFSAASFSYYLKRTQGRNDFTVSAFGILYAMCGYFVAYYWNVMWMDAMVYFPLVMLGIENIIERRGSKCYIAFLALTLLSNYYMGYMTCVFSVIYFLVYFFGQKEMGSVVPGTHFTVDENGNKKYAFKDKFKGNVFLRSGVNFAFSSIAAAGLVAFALLPTAIILKSCSATSGTMPTLDQYRSYYSIFDFLANHLASVVPTIRSSGEDVLPNVYCGIGTLILVPLYLFSKSISLKEKVANVALLGLLYISFNINILNYIWHGFHYPNDLPYRFSFMYCFILLTLAYKAFNRLGEFTGRQILGVGVALIGAIILIQKLGSKNVEDITVIISIIFTVTYCLVFYIMKDKKYQKSAIAVLLLCCVIGEIACSNTDRYSMDQPKVNFVGDYSSFRELKAKLDEREGNDDYRMELTYNRARMDPAWFGFNGISTFSSMAYEKVSNMENDLGLYGNYINSYTYKLQTPVYNMMHALKYVVNNDTDISVSDDYYTQVADNGKFTAYENKYYLPIGMAVDSSVKEWFTTFNNPFIVQGDWFEYATGVPDVFGMMEISDVRYYNMDEITSGLDTGDIYYSKTADGEGELTFILTVPEEKHCYLYVSSDDFDSITINKGESTLTQDTDEPYIYDLGVVAAGEEVSVVVSIEESEYGYIDFYPYYVNEDALNEGYNKLKANSLNVESFEATRITGTVNVDEDGLFYTSIPYDKGWKVYVDGKAITDEDYHALVDALLCFNITAGEHSIELKYSQRGLLPGLGISALTAVLLAAAWIFFSKKKKKEALELSEENDEIIPDNSEDESTSDEVIQVDIGLEEESTPETGEEEVEIPDEESVIPDEEAVVSDEADEAPETDSGEDSGDTAEESDEEPEEPSGIISEEQENE